jgi:hypothetical protein
MAKKPNSNAKMDYSSINLSKELQISKKKINFKTNEDGIIKNVI